MCAHGRVWVFGWGGGWVEVVVLILMDRWKGGVARKKVGKGDS